MSGNILLIVVLVYLLIANIVGFSLMGIDKNRAKKNKWRISEAALFISAAVGGSIGSICGMQVFRHKTKHWYFVYGMPTILILQIALTIFILVKF